MVISHLDRSFQNKIISLYSYLMRPISILFTETKVFETPTNNTENTLEFYVQCFVIYCKNMCEIPK